MLRSLDWLMGRVPGTPVEHLVRKNIPSWLQEAFTVPHIVSRDVEAYAEANHGRWIVPCPFCTGAQLACRADKRFFCVDCMHVGTPAENMWVRVIWPEEWQAIDAVLSARPDENNRNWKRGEDVPGLIGDNVLHGVAS